MEHTDDECQYHHYVVFTYLAVCTQVIEHDCFRSLGEPFSTVEVNAKEAAHEVAHYGRTYTQRHDDAAETVEHLDLEFAFID